jgi:hypothetical protein
LLPHPKKAIKELIIANTNFLNMEIVKKYFIRSKGKNEFLTFHLIETVTFTSLDIFFNTEDEAKEYAKKKNLELVIYEDNLISH